MYPEILVKKLIEKFPEAQDVPLPEKFVRDPLPQARVPAAKLVEVARFLKDDPDFDLDFPNFMTAVDYFQQGFFELVYYFYSSRHHHGFVLKCQIPRDKEEVPSLTPLWSGLDWQEREVYDLFGIRFTGHTNLKRIMMWEGFPGHPLRKDYVHVTDKYDSGLEIGTPGLDAKGLPIKDVPK